jgi:uncharacterized membrane protein
MAGLLMAFVPLMTIVLAHIFLPNNELNRFKIIGFILGISGVLFILGPSINDGNNELYGILLILGATFFYSINSVIVEKLPKYDPLVAAACSTTLASLLAFLLWPDIINLSLDGVPIKTLLNMLALGLLSTGLGALIYFNLINNAGAAFLSNMNYVIPVYAFTLGALVLGEPVLWQNMIALILIVFGIFVSRKKLKVKVEFFMQENIDVIIIGAGIAGITTAYYLQKNFPGVNYKILDSRSSAGGTWDQMKFPGVRADNDMYTYGFSFNPWEGSIIGNGSDIRRLYK